jgi:hypothetical protein
MSEFPASEATELVTKQFLRAELATLRGEMGLMRGESRSELALVRTELAELENRLTVRLGAALGVSTAILATLITLQ